MSNQGKFKTMTLIAEAELDRLKQKQLKEYNPSLKSLVEIQSRIEQLLQDPALGAGEKLSLMNTLQGKFRNLYIKEKNAGSLATQPTATITVLSPPPSRTTGESQADPNMQPQLEIPAEYALRVEDEVHDDKAISTSVSKPVIFSPLKINETLKEIGLPDQYNRKVVSFIEFLNKSHEHISRNSQNELMLDNRVIPQSSFKDLVRSLYLPSKSLNLKGDKDFLSSLYKCGLDPKLISNRESIDYFHNLKTDRAGTSSTTTSSISQMGNGAPKKRRSKLSKRIVTNVSNNAPHVLTSSQDSGIIPDQPPGKKPRLLYLYKI